MAVEKQPDFKIKERLWSGTSTLYIDEPMRSLELTAAGRVDPAVMVTHIGGLDSAAEAIFNLLFARTMATDIYDRTFLAQLDKLGIEYEIVGESSYSTPRSGLIPALGLD